VSTPNPNEDQKLFGEIAGMFGAVKTDDKEQNIKTNNL